MTRTRLPSLGSRGQGWVALQVFIIIAFVAAAAWGPRWPSGARAGLFAAGAIVGLLGAALFLAALGNLGKSLTPMPKPMAGARLKTSGTYALVRHPIYGGGILVVLAGALATTPLALIPSACLALLFEGKRRVEEGWLAEHYEGYADYMKQVRRAFIPFVW